METGWMGPLGWPITTERLWFFFGECLLGPASCSMTFVAHSPSSSLVLVLLLFLLFLFLLLLLPPPLLLSSPSLTTTCLPCAGLYYPLNVNERERKKEEPLVWFGFPEWKNELLGCRVCVHHWAGGDGGCSVSVGVEHAKKDVHVLVIFVPLH